jgi:hypothetical protein
MQSDLHRRAMEGSGMDKLVLGMNHLAGCVGHTALRHAHLLPSTNPDMRGLAGSAPKS